MKHLQYQNKIISFQYIAYTKLECQSDINDKNNFFFQ